MLILLYGRAPVISILSMVRSIVDDMYLIDCTSDHYYEPLLPHKPHKPAQASKLAFITCNQTNSRGVGAKLEVVRQNFRALSKFHDQN